MVSEAQQPLRAVSLHFFGGLVNVGCVEAALQDRAQCSTIVLLNALCNGLADASADLQVLHVPSCATALTVFPCVFMQYH